LFAIIRRIWAPYRVSTPFRTQNYIPVEQAQELVKIMQAKKQLIALCGGLSKEETGLDFSGQYLDAGDAVRIANAISGMGALSNLDLSMNAIPAAGANMLNATCKAK
jgi:hypothetical protein